MNKKKTPLQTNTGLPHETPTTPPSGPTPAEATFSKVPVEHIFPDPNQPRKFFPEADMQELTASVQEKGVLQPIMIRPYPQNRPLPKKTGKERPVYLLVLGERRWRAARAAGRPTIPASIRELSDEEALELQIIENLQRKDVRPMEAASAFKNLHSRLGVEEIALRVGKSPSYVAARLKLNDLAPGFKVLLEDGRMKLGEALQLCRFAPDAQKEILKSCAIPKDWAERTDWQLDNLDYYMDRQQHDLDSAPFPTEDALLYPEAGACNHCPHNSSFNKLLFPELNKNRICHNGWCYKIKSFRNYQRTIRETMADPEVLFVTNCYYLDDEDKAKVKAAGELGAAVLDRDTFGITPVYPPQHPGTWEDYRKENETWTKDEDYNEEQRAEAEQECRREWESEVAGYKQELKEYNQKKASGGMRRAFVVAGSSEGEIIDVILTPKKSIALPEGTEANETLSFSLELQRLQDRETRNQELDREKVYKRACAGLKECEAFFGNTAPLLQTELMALILHLFDNAAAYESKDWLDKQLGIQREYRGLALFQKMQELQDNSLLYAFVRRSLFDSLVSQLEADREKYGKATAIYELCKEYIPEALAAIEQEQNGKAQKRQENVATRIRALEAKQDNTPVQEPQPASLPEDASH
ncbi:ParB/RepB/Spo0J family partition protein [Paraflavisolibacter sp. H34]|uniref:ParB/RepB/Spo0J family partition protein n=1 Tax=Huijunlia imazamoxiresistens TaxID=3127457 RepID=UPI00301962CB